MEDLLSRITMDADICSRNARLYRLKINPYTQNPYADFIASVIINCR